MCECLCVYLVLIGIDILSETVKLFKECNLLAAATSAGKYILATSLIQ